MYKIAFGGIHIESSTFTDYISKEEDFTILKNEALLARYPFLQEFKNVEPIGLIHARALPGGLVSKNFFEKWLGEFLQKLKYEFENGLDGLLFDIHGAMAVEDMTDCEGYIIKQIRSVVGSDFSISTSMDLHGNVSDDLFNNSDLITCYRTAPHIDQVDTRKRALENLVKMLATKEKVYKVKVDIPMLLPGEQTSTVVEPGKSIYESIEKLTKDKEILDLALWMGFPWADEARCHAAIVVSGFNKEKVEHLTRDFANHMFNKIEDFEFVGPTASLEDSIEQALTSDRKPFFISDTGDNPGAGGSGDTVVLLRKLLETEKK